MISALLAGMNVIHPLVSASKVACSFGGTPGGAVFCLFEGLTALLPAFVSYISEQNSKEGHKTPSEHVANQPSGAD